MPFKKGDKVNVIDEALEGVVVAIAAGVVDIETPEGFVLQFSDKELVKVAESSGKEFSHSPSLEVLQEKEALDRKKQKKRKSSRKERMAPPMEVDLHIHQLTDSTRGMENHDMLTLQLDTAKRQLEFAMRQRIQRVVFIHGVGEGVLKMELHYLLKRYDSIDFYEAEYQKYGLGATEVFIYQNQKN